jgi:hypothetical protein
LQRVLSKGNRIPIFFSKFTWQIYSLPSFTTLEVSQGLGALKQERYEAAGFGFKHVLALISTKFFNLGSKFK